tara:strand:+ start:161 stop:1156 length:996 start_codon:yes stop_codon:yes gene_type:complete
MKEVDKDTEMSGYIPPNFIELPPIFIRPIRPIKAIKWVFVEFLFPWGFLFVGLAILSWNVLTPQIDGSGAPSLSFLGQIWLKNAVLLTALAGSLHWRLYSRVGQGDKFKFSQRWLSKKSSRFLWKNQAYDNAFWSIISGVTVWSLFEGITLWAWATGVIPKASWPANAGYITALTFVFFFVSSSHFYLIHRVLHWKPLYRSVHELHHRNVNTGPWSGISMHPVEHLLFFSMFFVWWLVPAHPVVIILTGFFKGLGPAVTHSGFDRVLVGGRQISAGDWFHDLHHRHFETNYGNLEAPFDWVMNTWHNGSDEAQRAMVARRKRRAGASDRSP